MCEAEPLYIVMLTVSYFCFVLYWQDYSLAVTVFESIMAKDPSCTFSLLSGIGRIYLQVNVIFQEMCVYEVMKCDACI